MFAVFALQTLRPTLKKSSTLALLSNNDSDVKMHLTHILKWYVTLHYRSRHISSSVGYGNHFTACCVLATEGRLTVCGAEGMDGCPGPTAAWRWGTDSPSLWGTLLLLCPTHWTIDLRLPSSPLHQHSSGQRRLQQRSAYQTTAHLPKSPVKARVICKVKVKKVTSKILWYANFESLF